ncbi:MAG: hypothetical protein Q7J14_02045 [Candidatus Magasanikbacteria bacterium]|nr:hypothetical protein [Candidatus Magasanikbacteria bacterium]
MLAVFGFFGKSQGGFFGINIAFGYGGGGGSTSVVVPTVGTTPVVVSGGSSTVTSRNINLLFNTSNAALVAISENADFSGTSWMTYSGNENFTLSEGYGVKTIYVKFRSATGGETGSQILTISYVAGDGVVPTATVAPATAPGVVSIPTTASTISFRTGLTTAQKAGITNLVNSGRLFSEVDAKNYAYAIGESIWSQFVGVSPKATTQTATVTASTISFRIGLTTAQRASIISLVDSGRLFSDVDAKNYAYAIGESIWSQFVGTNPAI